MRALLVLPLLLVAACDGSAPQTFEPDTTAPPSSADPGTVQVIAKDYSFSGLEGLTPKAGDTLSVTMRNLGNRPHDLAVAGPDGNRVGGVKTIDNGEQGSASIALAKAGVYTYVCTIGSHAELGMKGTFTVSP